MAARRQKKAVTVKVSSASNSDDEMNKSEGSREAAEAAAEKAQLIADHLPPLPVVFTVLACSGALWILAMRDVLATGRVIAGELDYAMQVFTKSTEFFVDDKGWKSTQGGLSAIQQVTTDANNMGGLFVRKLAGAAVATVHTQKLLPFLFHPTGARWKMGHFQPLMRTAALGNLVIVAFYGLYLEDFSTAGADGLAQIIMTVLLLETIVLLWYTLKMSSSSKKGVAVAMPKGKTSSSVTSNIVRNTVAIVSGMVALIAGRDLFLSGQILDFLPRDDIYLEWTGALIHSPPEGTEEAAAHGIESPLYIGEKYLSQLLALHLLISCMYKFMTAFVIRYGNDASGRVKCQMIWKAQALGDGLLVFLLRLFAPAARSASLDLRWHLMSLAYEAFILGLYGFLQN